MQQFETRLDSLLQLFAWHRWEFGFERAKQCIAVAGAVEQSEKTRTIGSSRRSVVCSSVVAWARVQASWRALALARGRTEI